ncbi:glycosyltransferase [Grimontia hollisae]|uniref:glycosyltransferase n=1 Tax=Grimontia hollisae TaxID=673 RepID=UPI0012AC6F4A|nr:glycosyltransferase [Grimontia hollisae]
MKDWLKVKIRYVAMLFKNIFSHIYRYFEPVEKINNELFKIDAIDGTNRETQDKSAEDFLAEIDNTKRNINTPKISAIYRVKNGAEYIELAMLSVAPLVNEIVCVDNGSTDDTMTIVQRLKEELKDIVTIRIYQYKERTELAGSGYSKRVKDNPSGSLAKFYNYCFGLGTSDYLIKCDAHYIFTAKGLYHIQRAIKERPDFILYSGLEIYGKKMGSEPFIFKNNEDYEFVDDLRYERLVLKGTKKVQINTPCFLHVKRISYAKNIRKSGGALANKYL